MQINIPYSLFSKMHKMWRISIIFFTFMHKHRQIPITLLCFVKQLKVIDLYSFDHNKSRQEG